MLGGLGVMEILLIGGGIVLLFGAKKIPGLARGIGESIRNFRGEMKAGSVGDPDAPRKLEETERSEKRIEP
jgi:sec-independent protein translocase protein TatA